MVLSKETLTDYKDIYERAYQLVDEESKNDPATNPYRSHYEARDLLTQAMDKLRNAVDLVLGTQEPDNVLTYKIILAFVYRDLGRINVFCDEIATGESYFQKCMEEIEGDRMNPAAVIPYVGCLNDLGILWANRENHLESKKYLDRAEEIYNEFKSIGISALSITDIFGTCSEVKAGGKGCEELEKLYTLTMFYMAQVLGHLGHLEKSAQYCNMTLRRQLDFDDLESIDWSLNAATLSQYYIGEKQFNEARHHLAASTLIMQEFREKMITPEMNAEAMAAAFSTYDHRYADIARCWGKYGLTLLMASKEHLMTDDDENLTKEIADMKISKVHHEFDCLSDRVRVHEDSITDQLCLTFEDAEKVFKYVISWLNISKEYYRADTEASEYAKIVQDYAELYKLLAFFEDDQSKQCKLHKKQAIYFEDLLKILNPKYYLSICRECWHGCAMAYSAILDNKLDAIDNLKFDEKPTPHALKKINKLCAKSIENFTLYIDSYKEKDSDNLQKNLDTDEKRVVLFTYFHLGRLYYKINCPNKEMLLNNIQNSLKFYQKFVDGCAADEEAAEPLKVEISICKEMVALLPHKITKTIRELEEEKERRE